MSARLAFTFSQAGLELAPDLFFQPPRTGMRGVHPVPDFSMQSHSLPPSLPFLAHFRFLAVLGIELESSLVLGKLSA